MLGIPPEVCAQSGILAGACSGAYVQGNNSGPNQVYGWSRGKRERGKYYTYPALRLVQVLPGQPLEREREKYYTYPAPRLIQAEVQY